MGRSSLIILQLVWGEMNKKSGQQLNHRALQALDAPIIGNQIFVIIALYRQPHFVR